MKKLKNFLLNMWERLLNPSIIQAVIAVVVGSAFIAVAVVFSLGHAYGFVAYIFYALAMLSLVYIGYMVWYGFPRVKQRSLEFCQRYEFTSRLVENYGFRTFVIACASLVLNALYAIYNGAVALYYLSVSSGVFALYYILLCILRGCTLTGARRRSSSELAPAERRERSVVSYCRCGIFIVAFTAVIVVAVVRTMLSSHETRQSQHLIYVYALYTFVRFGFAVYNVVKVKKMDDYTSKALRNINFADALVALFTLQTAMMHAFGQEGDAVFNRAMGALTGGAVCAILMFMGIYMIVSGRKALKEEEG